MKENADNAATAVTDLEAEAAAAGAGNEAGHQAAAKLAREAKAKEDEAAAAARTLGDVEAMINALEQDADLEQEIHGDIGRS